MAGNIVPSDYGQLPSADPATAVALPDERGLGALDPEAGGSGQSLGRYMAAVKRYKWIVAGLTIVGTAIGIVATKFIHPVYAAQATVYIQPTSDNRDGGKGQRKGVRKPSLEPVRQLKAPGSKFVL